MMLKSFVWAQYYENWWWFALPVENANHHKYNKRIVVKHNIECYIFLVINYLALEYFCKIVTSQWLHLIQRFFGVRQIKLPP